jgi:hypothetical protein
VDCLSLRRSDAWPCRLAGGDRSYRRGHLGGRFFRLYVWRGATQRLFSPSSSDDLSGYPFHGAREERMYRIWYLGDDRSRKRRPLHRHHSRPCLRLRHRGEKKHGRMAPQFHALCKAERPHFRRLSFCCSRRCFAVAGGRSRQRASIPETIRRRAWRSKPIRQIKSTTAPAVSSNHQKRCHEGGSRTITTATPNEHSRGGATTGRMA